MPRQMIAWNDKDIVLLVRLRMVEKLSYSQIAERMGITKNSAIGKGKRLGLPKEKLPKPKPELKPEPEPEPEPEPDQIVIEKLPRNPQARAILGSSERMAAIAAVEKVKAAERAVVAVDTGGVEMIDLEWHHCRWLLDNGNSCGRKKERGSYCAEHGARAYTGLRASTATKPTRRT